MIIEKKNIAAAKQSRRDDMIIEDGILISPLRGLALRGVAVYYNNHIPSGLKPMVQ